MIFTNDTKFPYFKELLIELNISYQLAKFDLQMKFTNDTKFPYFKELLIELNISYQPATFDLRMKFTNDTKSSEEFLCDKRQHQPFNSPILLLQHRFNFLYLLSANKPQQSLKGPNIPKISNISTKKSKDPDEN